MFNVFFYISKLSGAQYGCFLQFLDVVLPSLLLLLLLLLILLLLLLLTDGPKISSGKYKLRF